MPSVRSVVKVACDGTNTNTGALTPFWQIHASTAAMQCRVLPVPARPNTNRTGIARIVSDEIAVYKSGFTIKGSGVFFKDSRPLFIAL